MSGAPVATGARVVGVIGAGRTSAAEGGCEGATSLAVDPAWAPGPCELLATMTAVTSATPIAMKPADRCLPMSDAAVGGAL